MPKKKKTKPASSYTDFPILLHVDENGVTHYGNGTDNYFDAIKACEHNKGYNFQANREQEMRAEFDRLKDMQIAKQNKKLNLVKLEEKYGQRARVMSKNGSTVSEIAKTLKITKREAGILAQEV